MSVLEKIYDKSPVFFQNIMASISGYQRNITRYGKAYYEYLKFLSDFDACSLQEKLEYQRKELVKFIKYAVNNSGFYKKLYENIDINSIQNVEDLKLLPIIDKETLRKNIEDINTIPRKRGVEGHTGGTTGKALVVLFSAEDSMKRMAILDHFKSKLGFNHRKMKRATFNGKHIVPPNQKATVFWRYNASCKQMIYSSFHLTEENMKYYVESLNQYKPNSIDGFFTSICDVAGYIERHNIPLTFQPAAIFPTSETLTKSGRDLLECVFKSKVYDQYASSEGSPFVTECKNQVLHMRLDSGVIEHFDDDSAEILITSFHTHGTPLIRYRIGDSMTFRKTDNMCPCGDQSPIVESIQGRHIDFLYNAHGAKINSGNISNLFKNMPNAVIRAQLVQEKKSEVTALIEVDKALYKSEYDVLLQNEFRHKFGGSTKLIIKHVDEIPREKSGKFRMIKNMISDEIN